MIARNLALISSGFTAAVVITGDTRQTRLIGGVCLLICLIALALTRRGSNR